MAAGAISLAARPQTQSAADATSRGQATFSASCAGCHGLDARGGERAPGIANSPRVQRMTDTELSALISNGVPGTGMPPFASLGADQIREVTAYLRTLQGKSAVQTLPGDAASGKAIFTGKGECSSCHMMRGEGGFAGPDLTTFGATRAAKDILEFLTNPNRIPDPAYKMAVATLRNGSRLSGTVRNEDNFSIQLQTSDGAFHSLTRSDLQKLEYSAQSMMPSNYGQRLSAAELNDLVSYVISVGRTTKPDDASHDEDLREEDFQN